MQVLEVPWKLGGILLGDFLERSFPASDRVRLRRLCAAGGVRVNGMVAEARTRLGRGAVVQVEGDPAALEAPSVPAPLPPVLFESEHLLVVDKPAGETTVPDRARRPGIHGQLEALRPGADLRIVHRLDRETSGCLLLAKGLEAARHVDAAFAGGAVHKEYVALVHGQMHETETSVELWLGPDRRRPGKVVAAESQRKGYRQARTDVFRERTFQAFTLVRLLPRTGRGHQLRVHLAALGHPIVGDGDYGGETLLLSRLKPGYKRRVGVEERPLLERTFLHAERIALLDLDGQAVDVTAPMPKDLTTALDKVERYGATKD